MTAGRDILDPAGLKKKDFQSLAQSAGEALPRSQLQDPSLSAAEIRAWLGEPSKDAGATRALQHFAADDADQAAADAKALKKQ